ncbi:hypothetical protein [Solidesulfovibrio alcoholivorans]|uniref:hypothetical protein n=1 Tax=Solidesulfovibrio alcoholivorans TaxID=81406 RepID=UPI0006940749|nr:hypothetical protein [Solidesulfovibrio alcoholivorans]
MPHSRLEKTAAFASGLLFVAWIGGSCGAAAYKAVYWLIFSVWPETALYGLVPAAVIRFVLTLPRGELLTRTLLALLTTDLLTYILVVPPLLLAPCLAYLLSGRRPGQAWRMAARPFAPAGRRAGSDSAARDFFRRNRGFSGPERGKKSTDCG